ncbi:MAG: tRNA (adenosine(37)-N6)-threonylcarbamoyltransferase complex transferase subunit TsaD [Candidatus Omnitrophica bacterium]|nr:tRNA (adenosine(37)-N6)-threonylcarbamoyltransferase complex transferase subunit TsaD [Candidatus Omnitrophota bacterium]MBU1933331.1 tRNA (adenosine(37)-N6)-threonylcarbamoyltransferase complex transferase subunit TsaD [Candidatus Omnitrophota bacterium]
MLILGIETSCDETAASIVRDGEEILSNVISSSLRYHKRFGGVVPEIATRHHVENIDRVINSSLIKAGVDIADIDAVAVTQGPGLVGALLSGISCAKAIAYSLDVPLLAVDHVRAHIYSALMGQNKVEFPFIGLVVSGGHTRILLAEEFDRFTTMGDTLDDAIGEAYDKVAKILGRGYPGGPVVDRLARKGNSRAVKFTCRPVDNGLDFSFSGIKTAVLYHVRSRGSRLRAKEVSDIAASFQESALRVIVKNCLKALERYGLKTLVVGGGVSANSRLREMFAFEESARGIKTYFPPRELCSDNAAMVAGLAYRMHKKGVRAGLDITAVVR